MKNEEINKLWCILLSNKEGITDKHINTDISQNNETEREKPEKRRSTCTHVKLENAN